MTSPNRLFLAQRGIVHVVGAAATSWHANPAVKVLVPFGAPLHVDSAAGALTTTRALVVPAFEHHRASSDGPVSALLFRPEIGSKLRVGALTQATTRQAAALQSLLDPAQLSSELDSVIEEVEQLFAPASPRLDARVRRAMPLLDSLGVAGAAQKVGVSRFHLARLFQESTGMSPRQYALYERVVAGVRSVLGGCSVSDAAHAAGFADHAHFTRSTQRFTGQTPSFFRAQAFKRP